MVEKNFGPILIELFAQFQLSSEANDLWTFIYPIIMKRLAITPQV